MNGHSPLGASGAERWINCPGSVTLIKNLNLDPDGDMAMEEPEYREQGTAAHALAAVCLGYHQEPWELIGHKFGKVTVDAEMADAVDTYIRVCDADFDGADRVLIEQHVSDPIHPLFFGTVDCAVKIGRRLIVNDFKYGVGVVVEIVENPQVMYYAFGALRLFPDLQDEDPVELRIIQPRAAHEDGMVRSWTTTVGFIKEWANTVLRPAMLATELDHSLDAGEWCRFCPAKLVCPLLVGLFGAAVLTNPEEIVNYSDEMADLNYRYLQGVKFYMQELERDIFRRHNAGHEMKHTKLVYKRAWRVFKPGAADVFIEAFGEKAMEPEHLKSPAELEKLGADAKDLVHQWAYTPQTGLTVALSTDKRLAVKVKTNAETFANAKLGDDNV